MQFHTEMMLLKLLQLPLPECWGRTPLHEAVRNNHPEVVKILVTAGARVDAKDDRGVTPLLLAGSKVNEHDSEELNKFGKIVDTLVSGNVSTNVIHPDTGEICDVFTLFFIIYRAIKIEILLIRH